MSHLKKKKTLSDSFCHFGRPYIVCDVTFIGRPDYIYLSLNKFTLWGRINAQPSFDITLSDGHNFIVINRKLGRFPFPVKMIEQISKYNLFKCWFRHKMVGGPFVHSLVDSLRQIHRGLDDHNVKKNYPRVLMIGQLPWLES